MKKMIFITLVLVLTSSMAFAIDAGTLTGQTGGMEVRGAVASGTTSGTGGQPIGRLSNNVYFLANYSDTGYALATYHSQGTKAYGTGYDSTKIYWNQIGENGVTTGTFVQPTSSVTDQAFPSGTWTEM